MTNNTHSQAQLVMATQDLNADLAFFSNLGFRLDHIFPADNPAVAILSGHGLCIRLDRAADVAPATLYLLTDDPCAIGGEKTQLTAPNGTRMEIHPKTYRLHTPATRHKFEVRQLKGNDTWVIGRAGMLYRDLIPDRLGGSIIASHISIPEGGPVPDVVHYHTIGFQLIFCYQGWVRLVYEDQGPPFILGAGDCVTQPPEIRHRVLESSDNLEVIEIGVPAEHMTTIDHYMELPTTTYQPDREFQGQRFCRHLAVKAQWKPWITSGFECRDTGVNEATKGLASVLVIRPKETKSTPALLQHHSDIHFQFVLQGELQLHVERNAIHCLQEKDAMVIPPGLTYEFKNCSTDLEILEVALAGTHRTNRIE